MALIFILKIIKGIFINMLDKPAMQVHVFLVLAVGSKN